MSRNDSQVLACINDDDEHTKAVACPPVPQSPLSRVFKIADLLGIIFLFCIAEEGEKSDLSNDWALSTGYQRHCPSPSETEAPLLLTHVCQHWRTVALGTPRLWSRIHLTFTADVSENVHLSERRLGALLFWLNHSRSVPISVSLSCVNSFVDFRVIGFRPIPAPAKVVLDLLDVLSQHHRRWEYIRIDMPPFVIAPFYNRLGFDYPRLQSLELIPSRRDAKLAQLRDIHIRSAPNLENLVLPGVCERDSVTIPSGLPSSLLTLELKFLTVRLTPRAGGTRIRELVLNEVHISDVDFSHFPTAFPMLESLTVSLIVATTPQAIAGGGNEVGPSIRCVLDRLTRFKLRSNGPCLLIRLMVAPALKELLVINDAKHRDLGNFNDEIYWLLRRSNASVERFMYSNGQRIPTGQTIRDILNALPELRELVIRDPKMSASTAQYLEGASVCPRLTSIYSAGNLVPAARDRMAASSRNELNVRNILNLIVARCRRNDGRSSDISTYSVGDTEERVWMRKLALPLHRKDEDILRADESFKIVDVELINTHACNCD